MRADIEARQYQIGASCAEDARDVALGEVDRQIQHLENEQRTVAEKLDALVDKQLRQQKLIEDFAIANNGVRSDALSVQLSSRLDTLGKRVTTLEGQRSKEGATPAMSSQTACRATCLSY